MIDDLPVRVWLTWRQTQTRLAVWKVACRAYTFPLERVSGEHGDLVDTKVYDVPISGLSLISCIVGSRPCFSLNCRSHALIVARTDVTSIIRGNMRVDGGRAKEMVVGTDECGLY